MTTAGQGAQFRDGGARQQERNQERGAQGKEDQPRCRGLQHRYRTDSIQNRAHRPPPMAGRYQNQKARRILLPAREERPVHGGKH